MSIACATATTAFLWPRCRITRRYGATKPRDRNGSEAMPASLEHVTANTPMGANLVAGGATFREPVDDEQKMGLFGPAFGARHWHWISLVHYV